MIKKRAKRSIASARKGTKRRTVGKDKAGEIHPIQRTLDDINSCPRCAEKLLKIDGQLVTWLTCPVCRFKKPMGREEFGKIRVTRFVDGGAIGPL